MKRFWNFILSFIAPKKMEIHRDMNLFIVILLFLACAITSSGIPGLRINTLLKEKYLNECYVFDNSYDATTDYDLNKLLKFDLASDNSLKVINYQSEADLRHELTYKTVDGKTINLTIVYQFDVTSKDSIDPEILDLNEYLSFNPFNEDHTLKEETQDVLVVYTKDIFYYIFNHGYTLGYTYDPSGELETYHYINVPQWENNTSANWSLYETLYDSDGNIQRNSTTGEIVYQLDDANNKIYRSNLNQIFTCGEQTNIGIFSYLELKEVGINVLDLSNDHPLARFSDILVYSCGNSVKTYSYLLSFFYVVLLPLLWVFVMWLLLKRNGELTRFREYYAICAVSHVLPTIITAIIGLFYPYTFFAKYAMIITALYFLINVTIINTLGKSRKQMINKENDEVELKKINDVVETKMLKDIETRNEERASRIG